MLDNVFLKLKFYVLDNLKSFIFMTYFIKYENYTVKKN